MIRTLVVEDDFRVADIHRDYVGRIGGFETVGVAHGGREALTLIDKVSPDLVLLDIYLPDIDGLEVARVLATRDHAPDVIFVTAARDVESVRAAVGRGALHYLVKPFAFATLREKLESYATWRAQLADRAGDVDQRDVDALLGSLRRGRSAPLPKGLSEVTLVTVEKTLRDADGADLNAYEVAHISGISRVTARRYLEFLVDAGRAELQMRYGVGRPEHRYRVMGV